MDQEQFKIWVKNQMELIKSEPCTLGDRMKKYEGLWKRKSHDNIFSILRLDGKAFSSFTKGFDKPFDKNIDNSMDSAAIELCKAIQGAKFAYVQSDEISIYIQKNEKSGSQIWFNGNVQKIETVSSSICANAFNKALDSNKIANFDSRFFTLPDSVELKNYFLWRQRDWRRNSISMLGRSKFSHKQLMNKNTSEVKEMLKSVGVDYDKMDDQIKWGRIISKHSYEHEYEGQTFTRSHWKSTPAIDFGKNKLFKELNY